MKSLWTLLGRIAYVVTWPGIWLIVYRSRRTRILVVVDGKVLLIRHWLGNSDWTLPGGGLHRGEDVLDGALRELGEEIGVVVGKSQLKQLCEVSITEAHHTFRCYGLLLELSSVPAIKKQLVEILDVAWFLPQDIPERQASTTVHLLVTAWQNSQN